MQKTCAEALRRSESAYEYLSITEDQSHRALQEELRLEVSRLAAGAHAQTHIDGQNDVIDGCSCALMSDGGRLHSFLGSRIC